MERSADAPADARAVEPPRVPGQPPVQHPVRHDLDRDGSAPDHLSDLRAEHAQSRRRGASLLPLGSVVAIVALGQMLVIMMGGIDLSMGATISLTANVLVGVSKGADDSLAKAIIIVFVVAVVIGLVNGFLVAVFDLNPLIVTLATSLVRPRHQHRVPSEDGHELRRCPTCSSDFVFQARLRRQQDVLVRDHRDPAARPRPAIERDRPPVPGGRSEPAGGVDGRHPRPALRDRRLRRPRRSQAASPRSSSPASS